MKLYSLLFFAIVAVIYSMPIAASYSVTYILPDRPNFNITRHAEQAIQAFKGVSTSASVTIKSRFYNIYSLCVNLKNLISAIRSASPQVYVFVYAPEKKDGICSRLWKDLDVSRVLFVTSKYPNNNRTKIFWKMDGSIVPYTNWNEMAKTVDLEMQLLGLVREPKAPIWQKDDALELPDDVKMDPRLENDLDINSHYDEEINKNKHYRRCAMLAVGIIACFSLGISYLIRSYFCHFFKKPANVDENTMDEFSASEQPSNKPSVVSLVKETI